MAQQKQSITPEQQEAKNAARMARAQAQMGVQPQNQTGQQGQTGLNAQASQFMQQLMQQGQGGMGGQQLSAPNAGQQYGMQQGQMGQLGQAQNNLNQQYQDYLQQGQGQGQGGMGGQQYPMGQLGQAQYTMIGNTPFMSQTPGGALTQPSQDFIRQAAQQAAQQSQMTMPQGQGGFLGALQPSGGQQSGLTGLGGSFMGGGAPMPGAQGFGPAVNNFGGTQQGGLANNLSNAFNAAAAQTQAQYPGMAAPQGLGGSLMGGGGGAPMPGLGGGTAFGGGQQSLQGLGGAPRQQNGLLPQGGFGQPMPRQNNSGTTFNPNAAYTMAPESLARGVAASEGR
jgi:hypothetical protein